MAKRQAKQKKRAPARPAPLWVRIMALCLAALMLGTAIPVALLFFH